MGSVNLQVHLISIAYQIQYFTFWWSKISVVSKQNDQNIGDVSYKNVALFWQTQFSELILTLLCIVNIYLFDAYQFSLCCFEIFSTTLTFHEFSQRLYLDKCFSNLVNIWFNNKLDDFNTYFYTYIKDNLYIFVKRSSLSQEFVTKFSSILF